MRRVMVALIAPVLFLSATAFAAFPITAPPLPPEVARQQWGDSPAVHMLAATRRSAAPPLFLDYPGKRDVYTAVPEGAFDVTQVDVDVHIDLDADGPLYIETLVTLVALEENVSKFDFYIELPDVLEVTAGEDHPLTTKHTGEILQVTFLEPLPVEAPVTLLFRYQGEMNCDVQFMLPTCRLTGPWKYVTHSQFLPTLGGYSEMFVGEMNLWISGQGYEKWHAGGTGTYQGSGIYPEEGRKVIRFQHVFPTSLYAWSASTFETVHAMAGETPISFTAQGPQIPNAPVILGIVQDVLAFYSEIYVSYPWNNLDVVAMPKSFSGGFGPLSTIFVLKNILDATPENSSIYSAMSLLSHEIGHEWWGNLVQMADSTAVVLSEGLAEFSSNRFMQEALGGSRYFFVENNMTYAFTVPHDEEPIMVSPFVYSSPYYYQVAYQKGAAVIDMLRLEIGDETVLAGLKAMTEEYFMEYAFPGDLFTVFEAVSGQDLSYFYDQWLAGRGPIRAQIGVTCDDTSNMCQLRVKQNPAVSESLFKFNLPVRVVYRSGDQEDLVVRVDQWDATLPIATNGTPVQRVYVDVRRQLARVLRPALPGDIDLNGIVDGSDLLELSFAYQVNLVVASDWGEYFYANSRYEDLADVAADDGDGSLDGRVNEVDLDLVLANMGSRLED